jgi:hypothetical protein
VKVIPRMARVDAQVHDDSIALLPPALARRSTTHESVEQPLPESPRRRARVVHGHALEQL